MPTWIYLIFGGLGVAFVLFGLLWWWNQQQLQKPRERWDRFSESLRHRGRPDPDAADRDAG